LKQTCVTWPWCEPEEGPNFLFFCDNLAGVNST